MSLLWLLVKKTSFRESVNFKPSNQDMLDYLQSQQITDDEFTMNYKVQH